MQDNIQIDKKTDEKIASQLQKTPIAIIGMASLFPESRDLKEFWENIVGKMDCVIDVPSDRWEINDLYDADPSAPDKSYSKRGGFIPDIDFDPMEFGLPPNILEVTDSSQLLSLVVARDLIKDCGYIDGEFDRQNTGVILGVGGGQKLITPLVSRLQGPVWEKVLRSSGVAEDDIQTLIEKMKKAYIPWVENSFPGMLGNVIAGRVANRFDLGGTNCVVDAACAGSLAAMKMAISDLLEYKANAMITGGVDTDNSPFMYLNFSKTPAFTDGEVPKPFDEDSHGIVIGEGVGMVMLKRLEDAERDNDRIYAVIKGVGTSSDGRFKSIYAPRAIGQRVAVDRAYEDAGFDKKTVELVEAHGTGTKAGDAAEFDGLKLAFDYDGHEKQHIALGSVKSQIGHTKTAAGSAGLIKTALALYHKVLPATINIDNPNPKLAIEDSSFYLNTDTRPWVNTAKTPRRAGVSSFGFGGSNYHFVLEEYLPEMDKISGKDYRLHEVPRSFILHAENADALIAKCQSWSSVLIDDHSGLEYYNFVQEAEKNDIPRTNARLGFVAKDQHAVMELLNTAIEQLQKEQSGGYKNETWDHFSGVHYRTQALPEDAKVVALFSGQGSQYLNMCKELTVNFPPMRETFAQMGHILLGDNDTTINRVVFPEEAFTEEGKKAQKEKLKLTQFIQPAVGAVSAGLYKMTQQAGFKPDFVAGHSYGELTALWAAGIIDDDNFYSLSRARSIAMGTQPEEGYDAGGMLAVMGEAKAVEEKIKAYKGVAIANYNSPKQVVLAGPTQAIADAHKGLKSDGFSSVPLAVSAAFHSPLVEYAHKPFSDAIDNIKFSKPHTTIYSNVTAQPYSQSVKEIKESFKRNMLNSVQFTQEINNIADQGGTIFVEFGPKNVLAKLVGSILTDKPHLAVAMNGNAKKNSDTVYRDALVQLKVAGVELNLKDAYQRDVEKPVSKKPGMNIKLNGANYVSDATKKAFDDALNDDFQLTLPQNDSQAQTPQTAEISAEQIEAIKQQAIAENIDMITAEAQARIAAGSQVSDQTAPVQNQQATQVVQAVQAQDQSGWLQAQSATLKAHESYLQNQQDYSHGFFDMMHHLVDEFGTQNRTVPDNITQGISELHQYQRDTLRVHESYLKSQIQFSQSTASLMTGAPVSSVPQTVQQIPQEAPQAVQPVAQAPVVQPIAQAPASQPAVSKTIVEPVQTITAKPAPVTQAEPALNAQQIQQGMLEIVQDKTGYPVEMLDLNMNMEADLGIDSIKRVEILGAMTAKLPELPELDQNDLAEMQTLKEIVDYVEEKAGATVSSATVQAAVTVSTGLDSAQIQQGMLEIVQDKTGYPVEMLDLNMNMEADLGIDSIKRVEILGAMTSKFPELPELDQNDLAEMQTLKEIVDYVEEKAGAVAPVSASTTAAPTVTSGISSAQIQQGMLEIVNEKTGYPVEMLDLNMNMEADLGIDSIKRVEILGAMTSKFPDMPELDQNDLAEMQTLKEIVDYVEEKAGAMTPVSSSTAAPVASGIDSAQIQQGMLEIVNEKTGYPVEMLDLNMNMEADLGIDSIKRVEILGAMTSKFPELSELDQNDLAEMQTLKEIVDYVEEKAGATVVPASNATPASTGINSAQIQQGMLEIVNEKTGYPVEMLDLNMNMEADLGIDSIKRVEILGAMTSKFPDMPELYQNDLAEMQTLKEIVDYVEQKAGATSAPAGDIETICASIVIDEAQIQQGMLDIVNEKTGYPVEMLDLNMDMEADLGIDSIKRVEILGAMTSKFPELPEMDQNELSEMNTLAEIVDYVKSLVPQDSTISRALSEQPANLAQSANESTFATTESVVVKKFLPRPDVLGSEISITGRTCLITDNGDKMTYNTAKSLQSSGWKVIVMQLPTSLVAKASSLPKGVQSVKLAKATDEELAKTLNAITSTETLNGFIHLSAKPSAKGSKIKFSKRESTVLKMVFFTAKYLTEALTSKPEKGRNFFISVSYMDGEIGTGGQNRFELNQGGLNGLIKTANLEWEDVFCRAIDLSPETTDQDAAQLVLDEVFDPDLSISEVGYSDKGRMTLAGDVRAHNKPETTNSKITSESVFLVSGGAKGVTAACIMPLAEQYHCRFILAGRAPYTGSEPEWAKDCDDETELKRRIMEALKAEGEMPTPVIVNKRLRAIKSEREISKTLAQITALGGQAEYISADVTNSDALKEQSAPAAAKLGKITGLIHGAGVLADKPIHKKSENDFNAVINTKIDGLEAMLSLVNKDTLEYLVMFSSAAGFYGNNGQSDYSVANEILNKTAHQFKHYYPKCHVVSFNWGPWDGGMVTAELKRYFKERNVEIIPITEGVEIFGNELHQDRADTIQLLVGSSMRADVDKTNTPLRTFLINTSLLLEDNPFLNDHVIGGNPVLPSATALSWMANICERINPSYHFFECDNFQVLKGIVFDKTQVDSYQVDVKESSNDDNFSRLEVTISSKKPDGKPVWHYKANILVAKEIPEVPLYTQSDLNETQITTGETLYSNGTLFHGSVFQGIEKVVNNSMKKLTLLCNLDKIKDEIQGQFPVSSINPFATDLMFQAMLVWVREHRHLGSLPLKFLKVMSYKAIPNKEDFYISLDVNSTSDTNMKADVVIHDQKGNIYSRAFGAEVTVSESLNAIFKPKEST
ncbi:MAG: SDR family oxidoreductase [gamma proteobacterium symbiont of Bathyaustriella thionipta]|nr:SDR family oxidoreductase [gamma proteobacterium symbiont of Bathyaustriella thionipta]MCU7949091.1 SDR family oxidoreductase [gamma proteobacterium symbiont of Bathyaustriella thionipta]MCU7954503.1 SDR family oxidoreductase [gamma proteobacterium symbiont of Bathyaustriella thionipta]MCU7955678.1 SDR family oxidoreductase [gamma proteobacterium symbiont of Bathyaustriella thionipta]MCU7967758.1 SDR family oxidoreductase [gamma proteobacterium symbiont of Bathyaustriella thionipta]